MSEAFYYLFVDDSGSRFVDRPSTPRNDGLDYFAMGGLLLKSENADQVEAALLDLAARYSVTYPFHSSKIRSRKKEWAWLGADNQREKAFLQDLENLLCSTKGFATACVVDRPGYERRYSNQYSKAERWQLCKSAYTILVERCTKIATRDGRKLVVYVEQSGKREDRAIKQYHQELRQGGMMFNPARSAKYTPLSAEAFRASIAPQPRFFDKSNLLGQAADLLLFPLVKGGYDDTYRPYIKLLAAGKIIDTTLREDEFHLGVKYYCFENIR